MNKKRHRWGPGLLAGLFLLAGAAKLACAAEALAPMRVVSGDLPPYAIEAHPERPGVLVELTEAVLRRAGLETRVEFFPWARAMHLSSQQPRVAILPLTRTPEREPQYQWLLKLYVQHFAFINRAGEPPVASVEQARRLKLAVLRGSPNLAQLQRHGFADAQVMQASSVEDMLKLLERGHIDAIYGGELVNLDKARSSGRDVSKLQLGLRLESGEVWLAGGSGFGADDQRRLEEARRALLREGGIERIFRRYGLRPAAEDLR